MFKEEEIGLDFKTTELESIWIEPTSISFEQAFLQKIHFETFELHNGEGEGRPASIQ
jgi:hypothetical protein